MSEINMGIVRREMAVFAGSVGRVLYGRWSQSRGLLPADYINAFLDVVAVEAIGDRYRTKNLPGVVALCTLAEVQ
jgi:hypothetical protein